MNEAAFQKRVTDFCDWLKLRWHHETDSRRSRPGFPDLVIVGNRVIFVELKAEKGRVSVEQAEWINSLRLAGVEAYIWRPSDWPEIQQRLTLLARNVERITR